MSERLLVIEDDAKTADYIVQGFVEEGYVVDRADNGRDGLFLAFSGAFLLMAATPCLTAILHIPKEEQSPFYLLRLAAYLLIIGAILAKSLKASRQR